MTPMTPEDLQVNGYVSGVNQQRREAAGANGDSNGRAVLDSKPPARYCILQVQTDNRVQINFVFKASKLSL